MMTNQTDRLLAIGYTDGKILIYSHDSDTPTYKKVGGLVVKITSYKSTLVIVYKEDDGCGVSSISVMQKKSS